MVLKNYEYIFGTNFVVGRTSHKVAVRIPILVDISQVFQVSLCFFFLLFFFFAICIGQIYFVV